MNDTSSSSSFDGKSGGAAFVVGRGKGVHKQVLLREMMVCSAMFSVV